MSIGPLEKVEAYRFLLEKAKTYLNWPDKTEYFFVFESLNQTLVERVERHRKLVDKIKAYQIGR